MKIFLIIAAVLSAAVNIYCWRCTHYSQSPLRRSRRAGFWFAPIVAGQSDIPVTGPRQAK